MPRAAPPLLLPLLLWTALLLRAPTLPALAQEPADTAPVRSDGLPEADGEYHTPLAGEPLTVDIFGERIELAARNRGDTVAVTLGATAFTPNIGGTTTIPIGAVYLLHTSYHRRIRCILSGVVNNPLEWTEHVTRHVDAILHVENHTIPVGTTEVIDGEALEYAALQWGWTSVWPGIGLRFRVPPFNLENELRVQVFYQASYYYFASTDDTGKIDEVPVTSVNIPPDTYVHGLRARVRLDMIQRNLLELPHLGLAIGGDLELLRRDVWEDTGVASLAPGQVLFPEDETRDFLKLSGYVTLAGPVPFLSERHRLLLYLHGGWSEGDLDRFSGFRLGGGPGTSEADDLARGPFPGATFDQFVAQRYATGTLEYRFELFFFMYLSLRASYGWAEVPTFRNVPNAPLALPRIAEGHGASYSAALVTGFLWNSVLRFEYAYDTGVIRAGQDGHQFLFLWSKAF